MRLFILVALLLFGGLDRGMGLPIGCQEYTTTGPLHIIAESLVHAYQKRVAVNSVDRCPFRVSCSNFLVNSINEEGLIKGVALFIDRYFYRENKFMGDKYEIHINSRLLYDDHISESYLNYIFSN